MSGVVRSAALPAAARERAARVRLVLLDVDGVLTDGRLYVGGEGYDGRAFHTRDGHGIRMGQRGGLVFGIVSGRESRVVAARAEELYITEVHQGVHDKLACFEQLLGRLGLGPEEVCYIGDDLVDLPVMKRVGLAAAPADAAPEVREAAHHVTATAGGRGAVREVVDLILRASNKWEQATERYYR